MENKNFERYFINHVLHQIQDFWIREMSKIYAHITYKPLRASPSYKIADCELSNSYLLTHKIFSSNRFFITWWIALSFNTVSRRVFSYPRWSTYHWIVSFSDLVCLTGVRSYFKVVLWAHTPRAADFGCRIIDNELFIRNPVVTYVSEMTHFLFFGKIHSHRSLITLKLLSPQNEGARTTTLK